MNHVLSVVVHVFTSVLIVCTERDERKVYRTPGIEGKQF